MTNFNWKIGGPAGYGINISGAMFAKCFLRGGYHVFNLFEYPSVIRGGHNTSHVRVSSEESYVTNKGIDLLVALDEDTVVLHIDELNKNAGIIYDSGSINIKKLSDKEALKKLSARKDIVLYGIPMNKICEEKIGSKIVLNTIAIGASLAVVDYEQDIFCNLLRETFERKGGEVVSMNINAAKAGYDYIKKNYKRPFHIKIKENKEEKNKRKNVLCTGNEAIAMGAVAAGLKMYCAYPMTPASSILHYLAEHTGDYSYVVKHTEDEIAAINMAIGANFAGARAMTGTSGGGFSLMVEALGMAALSETPIVAINAQRPGPSTGIPTRTAQGDLRFLMHCSQGEFLRVLIAPGDTEECFYETMNAFNLAEKYQLPVLILSDKHLSESQFTSKRFDSKKIRIERGKLITDRQAAKMKDYFRYKLTDDGVSQRALPGQKNCMYISTSYEHKEDSHTTEEEQEIKEQVDKRFRKLKCLLKDVPSPKIYGAKEADITILSWGSTKGAILDAMKLLKKEGINTNFIQFLYILPFKIKEVKEMLRKAKKLVIIENNATAQLGSVIKENTCIDIKNKIVKYTGRQFFPEEIYEKVKDLV